MLAGAATVQPALAQPASSRPGPSPPAEPSGEIEVHQALARALEANPSVRVALLEVVAARAGTRAAELARAPTLRADMSGAYQESLAGTGVGVTRNDSQTVSLGLGLDWTSDAGTVIAVDASSGVRWRSTNRDPSTDLTVTIGPNYDVQLGTSLRQPLLRGAGRRSVRAAEREAAAAERRVGHERDVEVSAVVRDVLAAYWELWYAERALEVQREAEALAARQLEEARARVELGSLAPVDALRFASELASLRETRRSAEASRVQARVALAELLAVAPGSLRTAAPPPEAPALPSLEALLARVEATSPTLLALDAGVEEAEERLTAARDAARARLDAVADVGVYALWATDDALAGAQLPDGRPAFVASGGLELELPLGSAAADARRDAAVAQLAAARAQREQQARALRARVRERFEAVASARDRVPLADETASVAAELGEAERARLELGTTTSADLLQAQQTAREAALRRLRVLVDATVAAQGLAHEAGALLDRFSLRVPDAGELAEVDDVH